MPPRIVTAAPASLALIVEVAAGEADALSDALLAHGATAVDLQDALAGTPAEQPVFDEPGADADGWARVRIRALVPADAAIAPLLAAAAAHAGLPAVPGYALEPVADADWVRRTQAQFEPIRVSARLWVVPSWHAVPDPDAISIRLDPGLAFGTGSHPTTKACLRWLERRVVRGARVLDYGCGSGILAIAAMKLGAGDALGVDIDPGALAAARANAARNGAAARFLDSHAPLDFTADLVVANLLANPLRVLAPVLAAHCRAGGRVALAGILAAQAQGVAEAYAAWFALSVCDEAEGWATLEGTRR
jgi:ribosomal protein L11 methyltransferase